MALKRRSPKQEGKEKANVAALEAGEYEGRLVYVADLGLQERSYKGEEKPPAQQIALGIEIVGHTVEIDGQEKPRLLWTKPFNVFFEMSEKGNEYKFYKVFEPTARDGQVADWEAVLGRPCNVVVDAVEKDGNTYNNIVEITPIPKKYQKDVAPATIEPAIGDADDEDNPATVALYGLARYVWNKRIEEEGGDF